MLLLEYKKNNLVIIDTEDRVMLNYDLPIKLKDDTIGIFSTLFKNEEELLSYYLKNDCYASNFQVYVNNEWRKVGIFKPIIDNEFLLGRYKIVPYFLYKNYDYFSEKMFLYPNNPFDILANLVCYKVYQNDMFQYIIYNPKYFNNAK